MRWRFIALLIAVCGFVSNASASEPVAPVALFPDSSPSSIRPHISFVTDGSRSLLIDFPTELTDRLKPIVHSSMQFGKVGDSVVIVLPLRNMGERPGRWIFTTNRGTVTSFRLYFRDDAGFRLLLDNASDDDARKSLQQFHSFGAEFTLQPGESAEFVVQFFDTESSWMPLNIQSPDDFYADRRSNVILVSAVVAGSLTLIFFNILLFVATGKSEFVWLGAAEFAFALNVLYNEGYATIFFLYDSLYLQKYFGDIIRALFSLLMLQVARTFLATRNYFPALHKWVVILSAGGTAIILAALIAVMSKSLTAVWPIYAVGWLFVLSVSSFLPIVGALAVKQYGRNYVPLFIGWSSLGMYITYMAVAISGIFPAMPVAWHWIGPIGLLECVLVTLALGLHLRSLHNQRIALEQQARQALAEKLKMSQETVRLMEEKESAQIAIHERDRVIESSGHDTRHVLHALRSALHYSQSSKMSGAGRELSRIIEAAAQHLDEIVATSTNIGMSNSQVTVLGRRHVSELLDGIGAVYRMMAADRGMDLSLVCDIEVVAVIDDALVNRILANLVINAVEHSGATRLSISAKSCARNLIIDVDDNGDGMTERALDSLTSLPEKPGIQGVRRAGTGWPAIVEMLGQLGGDYEIKSDRQGTRIGLTFPNCIRAKTDTAITVAELEMALPWVDFVEIDEPELEVLKLAPNRVDEKKFSVLVSKSFGFENRMLIGHAFALVLERPLTSTLLHHPSIRRSLVLAEGAT